MAVPSEGMTDRLMPRMVRLPVAKGREDLRLMLICVLG